MLGKIEGSRRRGQQALQVHCGGILPAPCSQVPQPQDTPDLGTKPINLQVCDTSLGHCVLRDVELAFLFHFFCFYPII